MTSSVFLLVKVQHLIPTILLRKKQQCVPCLILMSIAPVKWQTKPKEDVYFLHLMRIYSALDVRRSCCRLYQQLQYDLLIDFLNKEIILPNRVTILRVFYFIFNVPNWRFIITGFTSCWHILPQNKTRFIQRERDENIMWCFHFILVWVDLSIYSHSKLS